MDFAQIRNPVIEKWISIIISYEPFKSPIQSNESGPVRVRSFWCNSPLVSVSFRTKCTCGASPAFQHSQTLYHRALFCIPPALTKVHLVISKYQNAANKIMVHARKGPNAYRKKVLCKIWDVLAITLISFFFRFLCCLYVVFAKIELLQFASGHCYKLRSRTILTTELFS